MADQYSLADTFPFSMIDQLKVLGADLPELLHWLMIIEKNLNIALIDMQEKKNEIIGNIEELTVQQKWNQMGEYNENRIEEILQKLTKRFTKAFQDVEHLIEFVLLLQKEVLQDSHFHAWGLHVSSTIPALLPKFFDVRLELLSNVLIIATQPGPVLIEGKPFQTEVRLLINAPNTSPRVRYRIITLADAAEALQFENPQFDELTDQATVINNEAEFVEKDGVLVNLQNEEENRQPKLENIERNASTGMGIELKCVILYEIISSSGLNELFGSDDTIWVISLPVVLVIRSEQLLDAYSTIIWDRAFGNEEQVDWMELGNLLKKLFANIARSENRPLQRPLSDSDLEYLRKKLDIDTEGTDGNTYTFSQFAKENIGGPAEEFSFWIYFFSICEVVRTRLLPYWNCGYIMGFFSIEDAESKLQKYNEPAFLLRFSDSELGALTVVYMKPSSGRLTVDWTRFPALLTEKELSFADLLRNFEKLRDVQFVCYKSCRLLDKQELLDLGVQNQTDMKVASKNKRENNQLRQLTVLDAFLESETNDQEFIADDQEQSFPSYPTPPPEQRSIVPNTTFSFHTYNDRYSV